MKNIYLVLLLATALLTGAGCSTFTNTSDAGDMTYYPKLLNIVDDYRPVYEVENKKVSGTGKGCVLFWIFSWGADGYADNARVNSAFYSRFFPSATDIAAKAAFYNACKGAGCDYLTAARYEVKSENYIIFRRVTSKVTGFPVRLTGVKVVKKEPYIRDAKGNLIKQEDFTQPVIMRPKKFEPAGAPGPGGAGNLDFIKPFLKFIPPPFSMITKFL